MIIKLYALSCGSPVCGCATGHIFIITMQEPPYQTTQGVCDLNESCDKTYDFDCGYRQVA